MSDASGWVLRFVQQTTDQVLDLLSRGQALGDKSTVSVSGNAKHDLNPPYRGKANTLKPATHGP